MTVDCVSTILNQDEPVSVLEQELSEMDTQNGNDFDSFIESEKIKYLGYCLNKTLTHNDSNTDAKFTSVFIHLIQKCSKYQKETGKQSPIINNNQFLLDDILNSNKQNMFFDILKDQYQKTYFINDKLLDFCDMGSKETQQYWQHRSLIQGLLKVRNEIRTVREKALKTLFFRLRDENALFFIDLK